jgi:hypothetical protein
MTYPSNREFKALFKLLPKWAIWLLLVMLFGRFVIVAVWKLFFD